MVVNVVRLKAGVSLARVTPGLIRILGALDQVARDAGVDLEISCGNEGHPPTDVHTLGLAVDVSVHGLLVDQLLDVRGRLQRALGTLFTVLYERPDKPVDARLLVITYLNAGATAPHFHIQVKNGVDYPPAAAAPSSVSV